MKPAQKYEAGILITILTVSALSAGPLLISSPSWAQNIANNTSSDQSLEEARLSYLSAWNNTKFNATFSTFIEENSALGYGVYEEHASNNSFRPGETMVLYVEPVGFDHMLLIDEQGNTLYLMNMTADYIISDDQGNELETIPGIPVGNIVSHRQNTELFLELTLSQASPFPEGNYVITYIVHDNISGESFTITKNVLVTAVGSAEEQATQEIAPLPEEPQELTDDDSDPSANSEPPRSQDEETPSSDEEEENDCDSAYPDVCIPSSPPDLNCGDISQKNFEVRSSDPHGFDGDNDGVGCES